MVVTALGSARQILSIGRASMKSNFSVLLAMTVAALAASGARADVVSNVEIENLRIVLHDLDPSDGIAPSLAFTSGSSGVGTIADSLSVSRQAPELLAPVSSAVNYNGVAAATAITSGDIFGGGMSMSASAFAINAKGADNHADADNFFGEPVAGWVMSPHTVLEMTGSVSLETSIAGGQPHDSAYATVFVELTAPGSRFAYSQGADFSDEGSVSRQGQFDWTVANMASSEMSGTLGTYEITYMTAQMVPEPASVTLFIAGLGLLVSSAFLRRRIDVVEARGQA
jgi:hypothetical protein